MTIAGRVPTRSDGSVPPTLAEQMDLCFAKIKACLEAADGSVKDLPRVIYYVVAYNPDKTYELVVEKSTGFLQGHRPASCFLGVQILSRKEFCVR